MATDINVQQPLPRPETFLPPPPPPPRAPPRPPPPTKNINKTAAPPDDGVIKSTSVRLKPLYWDKLTPPRPEHPTVWDTICDHGSISIDHRLMDTLFPFKSPVNQNKSASSSNPNQICLLDPRKSQNISIIIRSLDVTLHQILHSLTSGACALGPDTLEKLSQISLTKEEQSTILNFSKDVTKLADAESFLYHLLKSVPSPLERVNALLFKSIYRAEVLHVKSCMRTLELACKEIKSHGLFLKVLEAVLKAGNRMNAGTSRGNAKAFNLNVLCKLSDVKGTDGKTTLLHFVVQEVLRSEGKRQLLVSDKTEELANVKIAAAIDYDSLVSLRPDLEGRMKDIKVFLSGCKEEDGFVREMKGFLESADAELVAVAEEQKRVMEIVKRTTEYYQPGSSKDKNVQPLQLFVTVADFFVMFDKVCVDITRNL